VWNYETATPFLFGDLAKSMRKVEFGVATDAEGVMSFRVKLPFDKIPEFYKVAADGQRGCIMKLYREWQLSGDRSFLEKLYPMGKSALSYAWEKCIRNIRNRYDGRKRSPFDEAECGHHYGRAMASWSAPFTLTGFQYSGVYKSMTFTSRPIPMKSSRISSTLPQP
jgi:hypothetical protein